MGPEMVFNFGSCGKMITAGAVMRLVEAGAIDLDAPVNRYLRRWQVESAAYDPAEVTVARLLSHTSGLGVHGYLDHSPRRIAPPDLLEALSGVHLFEGLAETLDWRRVSFGTATLVQETWEWLPLLRGRLRVLRRRSRSRLSARCSEYAPFRCFIAGGHPLGLDLGHVVATARGPRRGRAPHRPWAGCRRLSSSGSANALA
jgi:hypothetical protein